MVVFPCDLARADNLIYARQVAQRHERAARSRNQDALDRTGRRTRFRRETCVDVEAADAFEDLPGRDPADRCLDRPLHVGHVDAVAGDGGPVDLDAQLRRAGDLVGLNVGCSAHAPHRGRDLVGLALELTKVVAEELDRQFGPDAFEQFIDGHLDGLREVGQDARDLAHLFADGLQQPFLTAETPFVFRGKAQVHLGAIDGVGVRTHLAAPDAADDAPYLRNPHQPPLYTQRRLGALTQRDRRGHRQAQHQRALLQRRRELRAEEGKNHSSDDEQSPGQCHGPAALPHEKHDDGPVGPHQPRQDAVGQTRLGFVDSAATLRATHEQA